MARMKLSSPMPAATTSAAAGGAKLPAPALGLTLGPFGDTDANAGAAVVVIGGGGGGCATVAPVAASLRNVEAVPALVLLPSVPPPTLAPSAAAPADLASRRTSADLRLVAVYSHASPAASQRLHMGRSPEHFVFWAWHWLQARWALLRRVPASVWLLLGFTREVTMRSGTRGGHRQSVSTMYFSRPPAIERIEGGKMSRENGTVHTSIVHLGVGRKGTVELEACAVCAGPVLGIARALYLAEATCAAAVGQGRRGGTTALVSVGVTLWLVLGRRGRRGRGDTAGGGPGSRGVVAGQVQGQLVRRRGRGGRRGVSSDGGRVAGRRGVEIHGRSEWWAARSPKMEGWPG